MRDDDVVPWRVIWRGRARVWEDGVLTMPLQHSRLHLPTIGLKHREEHTYKRGCGDFLPAWRRLLTLRKLKLSPSSARIALP